MPPQRVKAAGTPALTAKGRATREAFRQAGRRVFAERGYLNATIAEIAAEAGKSLGSFYKYFDNKEELLAHLAADFDAVLQDLTAAPFKQGIPPEEALRQAIAAFWATFHERLGELVAVFQASMIDERFAERWRSIRANGIRSIAAGIERAQRDGYCPGLDPLIAASALSSMIEHFCYVWQHHGGDELPRSLDDDEAVETLWLLWRHAVYWLPEETSPLGGGEARRR